MRQNPVIRLSGRIIRLNYAYRISGRILKSEIRQNPNPANPAKVKSGATLVGKSKVEFEIGGKILLKEALVVNNIVCNFKAVTGMDIILELGE